jgi:hypothetical protein
MKQETKALFANASKAIKSGAEMEKLPVLAVSGATGGLYSKFNQFLIYDQMRIREQSLPITGQCRVGDYLFNVSSCYTFNQVKQHGWKVRKGAKSIIIAYRGDDPVGKVQIDKESGEQRIEKKEGADYAPFCFRVFVDTDIEKDASNG